MLPSYLFTCCSEALSYVGDQVAWAHLLPTTSSTLSNRLLSHTTEKTSFKVNNYLRFTKYLRHSKQVTRISNQLLDFTLKSQRCTKRGFWERSLLLLPLGYHFLHLASGGSDITFYRPNSTAKLWPFQTKQSLRIKLSEQICSDFSD